MSLPAESLRTEGRGPHVVFIHGTGRGGDEIPLALLRNHVRATTYRRRSREVSGHRTASTVGDHANDAIEIILRIAGAGGVHLCGLSFGAVIALEVARRRPDLLRSLVLFEPPLPAADDLPTLSPAFLAEFRRRVQAGAPDAAAELFFRRAVTDAGWSLMTAAAQERARGMWRHISCDLEALASYRPRYRDLRRVHVPTLLLLGGRSRPHFVLAVRALHDQLPHSAIRTIACAGHFLDRRAWAALAAVVAEFCARLVSGSAEDSSVVDGEYL